MKHVLDVADGTVGRNLQNNVTGLIHNKINPPDTLGSFPHNRVGQPVWAMYVRLRILIYFEWTILILHFDLNS